MSKHTPGPWRVKQLNAGRQDEPRYISANSRHLSIARVNADERLDVEANARLIASAPDLLEALRRIAYEPFGPSDATHEQVLEAITGLARAAIANLEGGS